MKNWLSFEPGLSPADTVQIPSRQRDDNRRGGEEAVKKGRNRAAIEGYIGAQCGASKRKNNFRRTHVPVAPVTKGYIGAQPWGLEAKNDTTTKTEIDRPVIDRQPTGAALLPSTSSSNQQKPQTNVGGKNPYQISSLFSPIWPIDSAYGTGPITASYSPKTPPTSVTVEKTPVSFADDDVVISPNKTVDK